VPDLLVCVAADAPLLLAVVLLRVVWLGELLPQPAIRIAPVSAAIILDLIRSGPPQCWLRAGSTRRSVAATLRAEIR
jgi:hypothetical protein